MDDFVRPDLRTMGAFAGLCAQSVSYPLHLVKRRMQVFPAEYKSVWQGLGLIVRREGWRRDLFKGLTLTWLRGPC